MNAALGWALVNSSCILLLCPPSPWQRRTKASLLRLAELLARLVYRVMPMARRSCPSGGFLLLPNHITWVDAIVLQIACPRPIRFMVSEPIYRQPALNWLFRIFEAIPISPRHAREAIRTGCRAHPGRGSRLHFPGGRTDPLRDAAAAPARI